MPPKREHLRLSGEWDAHRTQLDRTGYEFSMKRHIRLVVDPVACDGHGVCAELYPEGVLMDRWGFPLVDQAEITPANYRHAARAVDACPRLALHLVEGHP
jgi:ferredoxin